MALTQVQPGMLTGNNPAVPTSTAVGTQALNSNSGATNTAVGYQAGYSVTSGTRNTFLGSTAGYGVTGSRVVAIGDNTLATSTSGVDNVAIGDYTMRAYTGSNSTAVGAQTLANASSNSGDGNTAIGSGALNGSTTASYNTAVGNSAGQNISTGGSNTLLGTAAGLAMSGGANNTCVGTATGATITSGTYNVCIGGAPYGAGYGAGGSTLTTGSYNIMLGTLAVAQSSSTSYAIVINSDNTTRTDKGNSTGYMFPGGGAMYQGNNSASWSTTSDKRLKKNIIDNNEGLEKITAIQVRNFEYRLPEEVDAELKPTDAIEVSGIQLGVIAQEIQQVLPDCVKQESTGVLSVDPDKLTWYMINAIKELKAEVDSLKQQKGA